MDKAATQVNWVVKMFIATLLTFAFGIVGVVMLALVYTQLDTISASATITQLTLCTLILGAVALGLQLLSAIRPLPMAWRATVGLLSCMLYFAGLILSAFLATQLPDSLIRTYTILAAVFFSLAWINGFRPSPNVINNFASSLSMDDATE